MKFFHWYLNNKKWAVRVAIIWTVLIFIGCLLPGREVLDVHIPFIDKWVHLIIFAGFSFLWLCVKPASGLRAGILVFLLSVLTGYIVELIQGSGIVSGRSYDLMDVVADAAGGLLGIILFFAMRYVAARTR